MKDLYYVKKGSFGKYKLVQLDDEESIRNIGNGKKVKLDKELCSFTQWPVVLKAVGYKGDYNDRKGEILKMIPPSLVERAIGFSLRLDNEADLVYEFDKVEATVTLYEAKDKAPKLPLRKTSKEKVFDEFDL